jgi:tetratricopeptide (TPR) repeat protein
MVRIGEADGRPYAVSMVNHVIGHIHLSRGAVRESLAPLRRSVEVARSGGLIDQQVSGPMSLARSLLLDGRPDEALALHEETVRRAEVHGDGRYAPLIYTWWAAILERTGRRQEADVALTTALGLARASQQRPDEAYALWVAAQIAEEGGRADGLTAEARYRQALGIAEELKMRPLQAHCHLGLGKLYRRIGRAEDARAELRQAITMLREMGMTLWLAEAEAAFAQVSAQLPA